MPGRQAAAIWCARRSEEQRATVHHALEGVRASGMPKSQVELAAAAGMKVETFRTHERAYLHDVKAELLARVVQDEEAFRGWIALYRCLRHTDQGCTGGPRVAATASAPLH